MPTLSDYRKMFPYIRVREQGVPIGEWKYVTRKDYLKLMLSDVRGLCGEMSPSQDNVSRAIEKLCDMIEALNTGLE